LECEVTHVDYLLFVRGVLVLSLEDSVGDIPLSGGTERGAVEAFVIGLCPVVVLSAIVLNIMVIERKEVVQLE
jgi:hypothetical protein